MNDSFVNKYSGRAGSTASDSAASADEDATDDLGAFGWLRGVKDRAVMLELRKKTGEILAIGYGWLERIEFDPSEGITLHAMGKQLKILGRNLNKEISPGMRLFEGLTRHRVPWVAEVARAETMQLEKDAPCIDAIEW